MTSQPTTQFSSRCTLCPAGCALDLTQAAPDLWRCEYPKESGQGLCPRGAVLGELLSHRDRIRTAGRGAEGSIGTDEALAAIRRAADGRTLMILLDGNIPCEQIAGAIAWCDAWPQARLCVVVEPAEEQLLLGVEASGAKCLSDEKLTKCDGFVVVGDVFAANPVCARAVLDCQKAHPRTSLLVVDAGGGTVSKFATHRVAVPPGGELSALAAVAVAAGVPVEGVGKQAARSGEEAAAAIADCKKLGVLVAAQYGRTPAWRQIGRIAGELAKAKGGGVTCQTTGANALAAVRLAARGSTVSLGEAMSADSTVRLAIGCDVLGMLGRSDLEVFAAAAALGNQTTEAAEVVLPLALPGELSGSYVFQGSDPVAVGALLGGPPAGVLTPIQIIESLARAAGVSVPKIPGVAEATKRLKVSETGPAGAVGEPNRPALLIAQQAMHAGCGSLTSHGSWQSRIQPLPVLRLSADDLQKMDLRSFSTVTVRVNGRSAIASVQAAPEVPPGVMVLTDGYRPVRSLVPSQIGDDGAITAAPACATVSA